MKTDDLTDDGFLDNRLKVLQPRKGYRAGLDAVVVAAAVPAKPGDRVFEAGIGTGVAALCLAKRVPDIRITGVEINPDYAALAKENAKRNGFKDIKVVTGDMADLNDVASFETGGFDHAFANPPYREQGRTRQPTDEGRRQAFVSNMETVADWVDNMAGLIRSGGTLTMILPIELDEVFRNLQVFAKARLKIQPLLPHKGELPNRLIYQMTKDGAPGTQYVSPLVIHGENNDFTASAEAILRDGQALNIGQPE
jgi:tRNA1(Val) A37 N6-methylase TrmN6